MARCQFIALYVLFSTSAIRASHTEVRQFAILVDGKEVGQSQMTIVQEDDGSVYMSATAKADVPRLVVNYNFTIEGQEWWQDGKLVGMKCFCNDNGKKCTLHVSKRGAQLLVRANGVERLGSPDTWTTSYWKLPDARFHNKPTPILAAETGQDHVGQLQYLGVKQLPVANQLIPCFHFRVTGAGPAVELWFDQHHRLVRQEIAGTGYKAILQLVAKK